jgi:hypothetical protein
MCRVFLIVMGCCGMLAAQQSSKSNWSVQEVRVGTLHEIVTDMRTLTPDAGSTVVGVKALVRSANADRLLIRTGQVFLQTSQGAKSELAAVGVVNKTGACTYQLTRGLVSGFVSVSAAGNGFKLGRKTDGEPLGITMEKNPETLCFAFIVAESVNGGITLHVEDTTAPVRLP